MRVAARSFAVSILVLAIAVAAVASAATAAPQARRAFVTHHEKYWSWAGPRNWHAGSGPYGITILGDEDESLEAARLLLHPCTPAPSVGASARRYFQSRAPGAGRGPTKCWGEQNQARHRSRTGAQLLPPEPQHRRPRQRQALPRPGRSRLPGARTDLRYRRSLALVAPARGFGGSLNTLLRVYGSPTSAPACRRTRTTHGRVNRGRRSRRRDCRGPALVQGRG